ncbi:MAG: outer rane receptor protein [Bacteroidetes bacterium]|jgi:iron complex outermembrane receptor protein|nr:outer rane receptor protein [Bacteroidota bacterium]
MNKLARVLAVLCVSAVSLPAQINISGVVTNEKGEAVSYAAISIKQTFFSAQTGVAGNYLFKNVKPGTYIIETYSMGYKKQSDTVKVESTPVVKDIVLEKSEVVIDEVLVESTRASANSGFAYSTMKKEDIQKVNLGQDMPYILNNQTSVVSTSDAGTGIGYTSMRIRGTDASRINVTVNGIPTNDPESQGTFWVDFPDLASSTNSIQVQRGVGSSTNGAGAFGGSINIQTNTLNTKPYAELITSGGAFNTLRTTLNAGTGLLNEHWALDARASRISSDGFIDRGYSKLYSWYLSGGYYGKKTTVKAVAFSGNEQTYQAWWGVPETKLNGEPKDSLFDYLYNNLGYVSPADTTNIKDSDNRTYNIYTYKNQTDNYKQDNYQLHFIHEFNKKLTINLALHYTKGKGYYEEFKYDQSVADYELIPVVSGTDTITNSDLIRRKWLDNDFYGAVYSIHYKPINKLQIILGGGANKYIGQHYGEIIWARNISNIGINHRYYNDTGFKTDINSYLKLNYEVTKNFNLFADVQYRTVNYDFVGIDYNYNDSVQTRTFNFLNPKGGFWYAPKENMKVYASFSIGNREPNRDDFTENKYSKQPKAEHMNDIEIGFNQNFKNLAYGINIYDMEYTNQLVLTGELNDVGGSRRMNVAKSYRRGVEIEAGGQLTKYLDINGNITLSQNKIKDFKELVADYDDYEDYQDTITHSLTDIAYSPNVISSLIITGHPVKNMDIALVNKYVGKQYLDNTSNENRMLDAYYVADLRLGYLLKAKGVQEIRFTVSVNNIFNKMYSSNGYTYGWISGGRQYTYNHYYPQAGTNVMGGISIRF